ncbi:cytochrome c biogenesis CcdA family protein [Nioella nitratireducens]|uniref:cytochrome c biogenesis CcdA family protein n=1 Tax=Nioella nitratireducens TaxID=1287720 RepID=UPI000A913925|nr:cytochrome c biogenesis CcdA family protein [Nioella nitratireducens]
MLELVFAYAAGLLTLINPCVLPVLPIVLAGSLQASRYGPLALAGGMSLSFVALGLSVAVAGRAVGINAEQIAQGGAMLMIGFGLILLVPRFSARFATATAGMSTGADTRMSALPRAGWQGQAIGGALLGAVWSPCVGPTLGGAISLASQGAQLGRAGAIMTAFALGVSTLILALGYGARSLLLRHRALMQRVAELSRPLLGAVFILVGTAILLRWHHIVETWLLDVLPYWLQDLSVAV